VSAPALPLAGVLDLEALWTLVAASLIGGVGLTVAASFAVLGAVRSRECRQRRDPIAAALYGILGAFALAVFLGGIGVGLTIIATTSTDIG
jgi:hypothetical protein